MPLVYQQNINDVTKLGVWQIVEDETFFYHIGLNKPVIQHPGKRLQTLAGRNLLIQLFPDFPLNEVKIAPTRKPFLPNAPFHFSISHCGLYAAAIVSRKMQVGVDIEIPQQKIIALKHKFVTPDEQLILKENSWPEIASLTAAWSMKEAVFKWYGAGGVDFKTQIRIKRFSAVGNSFNANILFSNLEQRALTLHGILFNGACLSWVLSSPN
ncbi:MAG: 4'-phosphopantetheinyl transferase superfamily protein [Ferruginibacter sp.]|nr:4'-phosphopantetheinyl transferase superfamily protein [Ferruginibacter sp.]